MSPRTHRRLLLAVSLAFSGLVALVVFTTTGSGDYGVGLPVAGDNAGPALSALAHGHLGAVLTHQPFMGLVSLVLRAPLVAAVIRFGGGNELAYRLGACACLFPLAILSARLVTRRGPTRGERVPTIIAALLVLAGPATAGAVAVGHPEEVLAITLATAAVIAALADRSLAAAILLGLAIGSKPWAVLAAAPVVAALAAHRIRALTIAGCVAAPVMAVLPLLDPSAFARAGGAVGHMHVSGPASLWWPLGGALHTGVTDHRLPLGLDRSAASLIALSAALVAVALLAWRSTRHDRRLDPLALLALLGLVRCAVDPLPLEYNLVAALVPLAVWEALELGRLPVLAAASTLAATLLFGGRLHVAPGVTSALTIVFVLALATYLARAALHRRIRSAASGSLDNTRRMPTVASGVPA